jgi:hypothetical protein
MKAPIAAALALSLASACLATAPSVADAASAFQPSNTTVVKTAKVDVDGDGRKDTVRIYHLDSVTFRVVVTTAKKKQASLTVTANPDTFARIWAGAATFDGTPGYELLVNENGAEEAIWYDVLTWKSGKLVREPGPAAPPEGEGSGWGLVGFGTAGQGMHFFTSAGKRYVDVGYWSCDDADSDATCSASVQRSVWRSRSWHSVKHFTRNNLTATQLKAYQGFSGVKVRS